MSPWIIPSTVRPETVRRWTLGPHDFERKLGLERPGYSTRERTIVLTRIRLASTELAGPD